MTISIDRHVKVVQVGSAVSRPGEIVYGWFDIVELPTGGVERLPVIICQGTDPGPTFWFTAGIHGDELTGVPAIHETITAELAQELRGTVVAIPSLNPAGLLTHSRTPFFNVGDPNRTFPGYKKHDENKDGAEVNSVYEDAMARLFKEIRETADFLVDLHCYQLQATPFSIRDRVLYNDEEDKPEAEELLRRTDELIAAFGLPVVNEYLAGKYFKNKLHRSTSGAALNEARIPSFTVELGAHWMVDPAALEAAKTGILNCLKYTGMLPGPVEKITSVPCPELGFSTKRAGVPRAQTSGLIRYHVRPGQIVKKGEVIASLRDVFGRPVTTGPSEIQAEHDGWIISLQQGLICYQSQVVANMAIRDDEPMIVPFPSEE